MDNTLLDYKINPEKNKARMFDGKIFFWVIFLAIMAIGIFLRSYHFSDWLHFELDQARDAEVISEAIIGGPAELPLLGPRAQGTFLRLGPAFYNISYLSAKIFGSAPPGIARGIWMLSILVLPLFYVYFRRFFDKKISIALVLIAGASSFLVVYSRFAWNPNYLVFFVPFSFYALLCSVDPNQKRPGVWFITSLAALSISTQFHFLAFIVLPIVFLVFLLIKRPRFNLAVWALGIFSVLLFYTPVFINEAMTGGDNTEEFFDAVTDKSEKNPASLPKKIFFNLKEHSAGYFLVLSGRDGNSLIGLNLNNLAGKLRQCKENCPQDYYLSLASVVFLLSGFALLIFKLKKETNSAKKDFLILNGIFFFTSFAVFTPLAIDISPRFFLLSAFLPFVFLGLIFESVPGKYALRAIIPAAATLILLFSNLKEIKNRFSELAVSNRENIKIGTDLILKEKTRVTYLQEKEIAAYMTEYAKKNGYPILFYGETRYVPALAYILKHENVVFNDRVNHDKIYRYVNYFWVDFTKDDGDYEIGRKDRPFYDIIETKNFGTLTLLKLAPKEEFITDDYKIFDEGQNRPSAPKRYTWGELL